MKILNLLPLALVLSSVAHATEAKSISCEVNHHYSVVITETPGTKALVISTVTSADESERPTPYYSLPATDKISLQDIADALNNGEATVLHALKINKATGRPEYEAKVLSIYIASGPETATYIVENGPNLVRSCMIDGKRVELPKPQ